MTDTDLSDAIAHIKETGGDAEGAIKQLLEIIADVMGAQTFAALTIRRHFEYDEPRNIWMALRAIGEVGDFLEELHKSMESVRRKVTNHAPR